MYRYSKALRLIACGLAAALLAGCTSPSQVVMTTAATTKPLVTTAATAATASTTTAATTKAPAAVIPVDYGTRQVLSGDVYPYASGVSVTEASFPNYYTSVGLAYNYHEYTPEHDKSYAITVGMPFDETVMTGENKTPYLVKDEDVSRKIVTRIAAQTEALALSGIPKMRGQQKYAEMELVSSNVYAYLQSLQNNVASYLIYRTLRLSDEAGDLYWISDVCPLTFDLNTGDLVPLAALFVDGYDYKARINAEIEAYLMENAQVDENQYGNDYQLRMLAPFTGIREDQPYYLAGERLYIVLDFENPEIHMSGASHAIDIPLYALADCLALYDRYATEEPLTAEGFRYQLTAIEGMENGTGASVDFGDRETYLYRTTEYMADRLPEPALAAFAKWRSLEQFPLNSYKVMAEADAKLKGGYTRSYDQTCSVSVYGGYAVMEFRYYMWGFAQEDLNRGRNAVYCWNLAENRPAAISDYFVEGYDYASMIEEYIRDTSYLSPILTHVESFDELIDTSVPSLDAAAEPDTIILYPQRYGLGFILQMSGTEKWGELYTDHGGYLSGSIQYEHIGYENLTLFQE